MSPEASSRTSTAAGSKLAMSTRPVALEQICTPFLWVALPLLGAVGNGDDAIPPPSVTTTTWPSSRLTTGGKSGLSKGVVHVHSSEPEARE